MLTIDKAVPLPPRKTGKSSSIHIPFRQMNVGDSVLVSHAQLSRSLIAARVKDANKRMLGHWVTRLEGEATRVYMKGDFRQTHDLV
jgi:hypothetical protein